MKNDVHFQNNESTSRGIYIVVVQGLSLSLLRLLLLEENNSVVDCPNPYVLRMRRRRPHLPCYRGGNNLGMGNHVS